MTDKELKQKITDGDIEKVSEKVLMSYFENRDKVQGLPQNAIKWLIYHGMVDKVPREDLTLMADNLEAREHYVGDGISNLYKMVCLQAVEDYKGVRQSMTFRHMSRAVRENLEERKKTLETFFASEFFLSNTGCASPKQVIESIERQMKARAQACMV